MSDSKVKVEILSTPDEAKSVAVGSVADAVASVSSGAAGEYYSGNAVGRWRSFAADARAVTLAGFSAGANTAVAATDTILEAISKVQGQINATNSVVGNKLTNPLTTRGDIVIAGASANPIRLGLGTSGAMLLSNGTEPVYGFNPILSGYKEYVEVMANGTINVATSNVKIRVLSAAETISVTGAVAGYACSFTLLLVGGTTYAVTWPASFKWVGGSPPTLAANSLITGFSTDGGTSWIVSFVGGYA